MATPTFKTARVAAGASLVGITTVAALCQSGILPSDSLRFLPLRCPLALLGCSCPTCGLGRSVFSALRGDFSQSVSWHPFGLPLIVLLVCGCFAQLSPWQLQLRRLVQAARDRLTTRRQIVLCAAYAVWGFILR